MKTVKQSKNCGQGSYIVWMDNITWKHAHILSVQEIQIKSEISQQNLLIKQSTRADDFTD